MDKELNIATSTEIGIAVFIIVMILTYLINDAKRQIINYIEIVRNEILEEIRKSKSKEQ